MNRRFALTVGVGCGVLALLVIAVAVMLVAVPFRMMRTTVTTAPVQNRNTAQIEQVRQAGTPAATFTPPPVATITTTQATSGTQAGGAQTLNSTSNLMTGRYNQLHPGVVSILVVVNSTQTGQQGAAAGSGFILDNQGHIVTNNHVVANATFVMVAFADGAQEQAKVLGTDLDSDLAVIQVSQLPQGMHPLPLGDSNNIQVGDWVIAIGNPFGLGGSMTLGIVSALGRSIPAGVTPFSIPGAIQTDAAINPGNSGGPLIDLNGQVIGINAQIQTTSQSGGNTGVGFAIPANVVRHVVPSLITNGAFQWPWLGIAGGSVGLLTMEANKLPSEQGAYISQVVQGGPAQKAGLKGSSGQTNVNGIPAETGGDVVVQVDNQPVNTFDDMLSYIAFKAPGDKVTLTVLRNGQRQQVPVTLTARPANIQPDQTGQSGNP
ncbi:MAG: trypsin-like peptidase domain-containing protein [Caldilineaceae bacterium]